MSFRLGFTLAADPARSSSTVYTARVLRLEDEEAVVEVKPLWRSFDGKQARPLRRVPTSLVLEAAGAVEGRDFYLRERLRPPEAPVYTVLPWLGSQQVRKFFDAVMSKDIPRVHSLLMKNPALVHAVDSGADEATPLHAAVLANDARMIEYLIRCGADVNAGDRDGNPPLAWAVCKGRRELVGRLATEFGAALDAGNAEGQTPLAIALAQELPGMVTLLNELQQAPRKPPREPAPTGWNLKPVAPGDM